MNEETAPFKCGYVALIGRPNAGKSTLLNAVLGSKLAITSAKPQTTRNRIAGIHTDERMQVILVDTPGIHDAFTELNKAMVDAAMSALDEVDVVLWVEDMTLLARRVEQGKDVLDPAAAHIAEQLAGRKVVFVANKMDVVPKPLVLPVIAAISEAVDLLAAIPISALTGDGVDVVLDEIASRLPEHPPMFPEDEWAQVSERFLVAEVIREKLFHLTEQEIPYASFVEIEQFDESARETENLTKIYAKIFVERPSQKGIVIGKKGEMLRRIGTMARKELQELLGCRVYLELFVKVEKDWSRTKKGLRRVGFDAG
ncbi:MAG: GTPase Era [Deltaproteobacteria bacterium]|nr:MAG: GTPase Era [Deltaproteobacteria bacterium]